MNLVDPRYFKQEAHVGQWVNAMVRLEGAAVAPLALTMLGDWMLEASESVEAVVAMRARAGSSPKGAKTCRSSHPAPANPATDSCRCCWP